MSMRSLCLVGFTAILGSSAVACSAQVARPAVSSASAVECPGTTLRSDADVSGYAQCSSVRGDLRIEAGVTDLGALAGLQQVVEQELVLRQNLGLSKREVTQVMERIPQRQGAQAAAQVNPAAVQ